MKPGIVHRLDRLTSGLIVIAKNDDSHNHLAEQIATRSMQRNYIAFCQGSFAPRHLAVDAPIGRHRTNRLTMTITNSGRAALTHFTNLKTTKAHGLGTSSILLCKLHSGRTHQVRVHAAFKRFPLLNDTLYGGKDIAHIPHVTSGRQMLHAFQIALNHPKTNERMTFTAPPPQDMQSVYHAINRGETVFQNPQQHAPEIFQD